MGYQGRIAAAAIVVLFNIIRYVYYQLYLGYPFEKSFFVPTAVFLAVAWVGGWQYDKARYFAEKDPLSDTYNRRSVDKLFRRLAAVCKRQDRKLGVILIDLDDFKQINDELGHQTGDLVLRHVADTIRKYAKTKDIIVRWGGDEFIHMIPYAEKEWLERYIRVLTEELSGENGASVPAVGISIGLSVYPDDGNRLEILIQQADAAMYKMKSAAR